MNRASVLNQEVFFGAVSGGSVASLETGHSADRPGDLPRIGKYRWGESSISLEGCAEIAVCAGQGILFVGSLFNAAELAERLGLESHDSPALLLHAYRRWGAEFPNYLHGEFTFALWDSPAESIFLGRDASGYKPIFYTQVGDNFAFATDLPVLRARLDLRLRPNESWVANWLALNRGEDASTVFEGIYSVRPGQMLFFERGRLGLTFFFRPENTPILRLKDPREYAEGLRAVLGGAVGDRLPRDSVAGTQLSGGLDSSSVTALAAGILEREGCRMYAFTAVPEHPVTSSTYFCDEGPHAASVIEMYRNVDHVLVRNGSRSVFSTMDLASSAECEPVYNPGNYPWIYEINVQARRRGVRVLLTAYVGNATISYNGSEAISTLAREGRLITAARVARDLHRQEMTRWRGIAHLLLRPWLPAPVRHAIDRSRGLGIYDLSAIRPRFARAHGVRTRDRVEGLDSTAARLWPLRSVDHGRTVAAFRQMTGVSMSDPTIDPVVVNYCFSVPIEYFCEGGVPRSLIRNAMAGFLPDRVRLERRRGLQAADFGFHFRAERQEALAELSRMKEVELVVRALDLESIEQMMHWSEAQITKFDEPTYWAKLMRAFSMGRFLRRLEDGTLFSSPPTEPAAAVLN